jgi:eukaryotic-like serine/threonine-protein kinase
VLAYTATRIAVCVAPKLAGLKLAAARTALRKGDCTTGKVKRRRSRKVRAGHVISSNPRAGRVAKAGTLVSLTLSRGKH